MFISKHHYALELARCGNTVYFVNPPLISGTLKITLTTNRIDETLPLYIVQYNLPRWVFRARFKWRRLYDVFIEKRIIPLLNALEKWSEVWCFELLAYHSLNKINASKKLLFVADLQKGKHIDTTLLNSCDGVVSISQYLLAHFSNKSRPALLLNHGLGSSFEALARVRRQNVIGNHSPANLKIGYTGNLLIGDILDYDSLSTIVSEHPQLQFHFWGAYKEKEGNIGGSINSSNSRFIAFLQAQPNVILHGAVPQQQLAAALQEMDAFILAYSIKNDVNQGSNSHKILEYLSTGRVVISSKITTYEQQPGLLEMVKEDDNSNLPVLFKYVVDHISDLNAPEHQQQRIDFALQHTYKENIRRVEQFLYGFTL